MSPEGTLRNRGGTRFDLIETMRWEPGTGFVRLERHLARLHASATELGFSHDPNRIDSALRNAVVGHDKPLRVRLVLSADGEATASTQPYEPLPQYRVWDLRIASTRLHSGERLLRHKTTWREAFVKARSEYHLHHADEVILLNERGEVCEGTITNVFLDAGDGVLLTPPLASGLLPGVLRAELLADGHAREAVLGPDDLTEAESLFVGNSLRGLIPAKLTG
ncbi:aminotransferase class IV family protein [Mesorhizobium sp. BAC0120]|uniref:aminotransferase class IV family protein n=1 Tax=Mesorhizobium sp. BAC0120 TaxID=3090670 RepID=UPI00298CBA32|nr:aminotransferase class IV family protein [Mesorhizobium sp. BAC0120]MDW6025063.1 aminotransferase class IV family protein [Mesorhizobium sp. BAC0120]